MGWFWCGGFRVVNILVFLFAYILWNVSGGVHNSFSVPGVPHVRVVVFVCWSFLWVVCLLGFGECCWFLCAGGAGVSGVYL